MLWMYMAMLETAEQKDKIAYIYENYAGMMYHVAIGVVGEHYLAEDVVHETFLRLIRIIDEVETDGTKKLKRFLVLLTHSKAVDAVRKLNKMKPTSDDELANHPTTEGAGCFCETDGRQVQSPFGFAHDGILHPGNCRNFGNHAAECKGTASPGKADDSERNGGTRWINRKTVKSVSRQMP